MSSMLIEGYDGEGNPVLYQIVERKKTMYLRKKRGPASSPREIWNLKGLSAIMISAYGEKMTGRLPPTAEKLIREAHRLPERNPYPRAVTKSEITQEKYLSRLTPSGRAIALMAGELKSRSRMKEEKSILQLPLKRETQALERLLKQQTR